MYPYCTLSLYFSLFSKSTTEDAAIDVAAFVFVFFEHFKQFKGRAFHLSGESYGGRYLPVFASAIYDLNPRLEKAGYTPINLKSVLIGTQSYLLVAWILPKLP
jgi:carboxypeptidase C (cathepsin A)